MTDILKTPVSGPNPLCAETMSVTARASELGYILAVGLMRLKDDKSSSLSAIHRDSFVDVLPRSSSSRQRTRIRIGGPDLETA
jgi:hypothetical protein